jgi:hypothetical protein
VDWAPPPDHLIAPQDRLIVIATRAGLGLVLNRGRGARLAGELG